MDEGKFTFTIAMEGKNSKVSGRYGVQAIPTNYLVDGEGKIVFRSVGFNEVELRAALEKLGIK